MTHFISGKIPGSAGGLEKYDGSGNRAGKSSTSVIRDGEHSQLLSPRCAIALLRAMNLTPYFYPEIGTQPAGMGAGGAAPAGPLPEGDKTGHLLGGPGDRHDRAGRRHADQQQETGTESTLGEITFLSRTRKRELLSGVTVFSFWPRYQAGGNTPRLPLPPCRRGVALLQYSSNM